jgi:hypothetical protein
MRVAAVEPVHLALEGGPGLSGAQPGDHPSLSAGVVNVAHDAMGADPRLPQLAVRRQEADVAGILAVVVGEAEDGDVRA